MVNVGTGVTKVDGIVAAINELNLYTPPILILVKEELIDKGPNIKLPPSLVVETELFPETIEVVPTDMSTKESDAILFLIIIYLPVKAMGGL